MSFQDLQIQTEYRSLLRNVVTDFYTPVLTEAVLYQRAVGFFSSTALINLTEGIRGLLENGGRIEIIASPKLSEEDVAAIRSGLARKDEVLQTSLIRELKSPSGPFEEARLNLLANLIASNVLTIKIALLESENSFGMFHEKMGVVYDNDSNSIAFTGSMNETASGFYVNYEAIDVYTSWSVDADRVKDKIAAFKSMWENFEPGVKVSEFPCIDKAIIDKYMIRKGVDLNDLDNERPEIAGGNDTIAHLAPGYPHLPAEVTLRGYQMEAISGWEERDFRGVFDMATGTGKTFTALAGIVRLAEVISYKLGVVIVCPYQHLVDQWVEDIKLFGMKPIVGYSTSPQRDWERRLDDAIRLQAYGARGHDFFCFICTNGTYSKQKVQELLNRASGNMAIVVDEAHNFGAQYLRTLLRPDFRYRLALSATIERFGDPEGTEALFDYFGERCIEYTLEEAIKGRGDEPPCLTPYRYHPIVVCLNEDERSKYAELSKQIAKAMKTSKNGKKTLTERGKKLVLKRARLVASASEKLPALKNAMGPFKDDSFMLVYCGATTVEVGADNCETAVDDYEVRQIDAVTHILGDNLGMRIRQFTSRENRKERGEIRDLFMSGDLQALIAIKCLDEGVNIPMIKTAFILASTTNPREYVQRRGRLLRRDKAGLKTRAEIFDFITLSRPLNDVKNLPEDSVRGEMRLAYNELLRAKEFARLAENYSAATLCLNEIEEAYFGVGGIAAYVDMEDEN